MTPPVNAQSPPLSSAMSSAKSVTSWKPIGSIRLIFSCGTIDTSSLGSLQCSLSSAASADSSKAVFSRPTTLVSGRIIPSPQHHDDSFLLQSSTRESPKDENLHMGTINALLLSLKSAMLFRDSDDSSRLFVYAPRSLHTASLVEHNQQMSRPKVACEKKVECEAESHRAVVNDKEKKADKEPPQQAETQAPPMPIVEAVDPSELKNLYQQCIESGTPSPQVFCQQAAVSLSEEDVSVVKELLVTCAQLQDKTDIVRTLQVQVGLRLVLSSTFPNFDALHHELVYKSVSNNKKVRKRLKRTDPQQVFHDQVLSLLSLLQIRCESPSDFAPLVKQLCVGVSEEMVRTIYDHLELDESQDDFDGDEVQVPTVTPAAAKPTEHETPSPAKASLPPLQLKEEEKAPEPSDDTLFVPKSISLTASQSTRKNSLVPNRKRKYVGSHFGTRLSNVSSLFRQVKVPVPVTSAPKARTSKAQTRLKPRTPKRPRTISFRRGAAKQVITETPAKRLAYELSPMPHELSPIGRSDSQNARLVAQEALAAARRKSIGR